MSLFLPSKKYFRWLFLMCGTFVFFPTLAQESVIRLSFSNPPKDPIPVSLLTGQSMLLIFSEEYGRMAVPNQEVAESIPMDSNQLLISGKAPGQSTVVVWSKNGTKFIFVDVSVRVNLTQLEAQIRVLLPKEDVQLSQANGSVVLSGNVSSARIVQRADTIAQSFGFKTVNLLAAPVGNEQQVQLLVRVAEVNRNKIRELAATPAYQSRPGVGGYSNTGSGPWTLGSVDAGNLLGTVASTLNLFLMNGNAFLFIRALQSQGALRALAEPNLVAMNGQQASFLAGGEIPIPVVQGGGGNSNGAVSIQYKEYGVRLTFKPNIIDEEHIRLELEPEVSTLDYSNSVRLNGFQIPALRTRKAKTGIELRDGQSFALAGLLDNNEVQSLSKVPWIGNVPLLGALFTSKQFQKQETELVFFVTVKLTNPITPDSVPQMRGLDGLKSGSPLADRPVEPATRNRTTKKITPPDQKESPDPKAMPSVEAPANTAPVITAPILVPKIATTIQESVRLPDMSNVEKLVWKITIPELQEPLPPAPGTTQVRREK